MQCSAASTQGIPANKKLQNNVQTLLRRGRSPSGFPYAFQHNRAGQETAGKATVDRNMVSTSGLGDTESCTPHLPSMGEMTSPPHVGRPKSPVVAVIGTGYIGLQLVAIFGQKHRTVAFDICEDRIKDVSSLVGKFPNVLCSTNASHLVIATHFLIAVPTGLCGAGTEIDVSALHTALDTVGKYAQREATVVIESSVAVGMTRKLLGPLLVTKALKGGMSPERVDPGRIHPPVQGIPKIISGLDDISPGSLESIESLYRSVFPNLVKVSAPEVAEMTKLYENCQRMVCIAYANEMADACAAHNIDPFEVSSAAATKPFGYSPIAPGIGAGGSCIPVNPHYLFHNGDFPLLKVATESTRNRPSAIADQVMFSHWEPQPKRNGFSSLTPSILVVGVAFKPGQAMVTLSPGVALIRRLKTHWKASVAFVDPLVQAIPVPNVARLDESKEWHKQRLEQFDIIIVAVKQNNLDFALLHELDNVRLVMCCA